MGGINNPKEREAERAGVVAKDENTNQEEHVSETSHNECLLGGCHSCTQWIVETDEQIGRHTHELPEHVHLEDVGGQHKSEHRHGEEAQEGIVALETLLTVHVTKRIDVHHERHRGDDNEHDHRDGVEQDAHVEMQFAKWQPGVVIGHYGLEGS